MLLERLMSDPDSGQNGPPHPPDVVVVVVVVVDVDVDVDVDVGVGGGVGGGAAAVVVVLLLPFQPCDLRSCPRNAPTPRVSVPPKAKAPEVRTDPLRTSLRQNKNTHQIFVLAMRPLD